MPAWRADLPGCLGSDLPGCLGSDLPGCLSSEGCLSVEGTGCGPRRGDRGLGSYPVWPSARGDSGVADRCRRAGG
ncbi:hypothetical protein KBI5_16955, partial [Frankia sp. KB5]